MRSLALRLAALGLVLTALPACNGENEKPGPSDLPEGAESSIPRDLAPNVAPKDSASLVRGNTRFAFDIYPGFAHDSTSNVFYSPYSISLALAMTYAGAKGDTKKEIAEAMHFVLPDARLHKALDALDLALESRSKTVPADGGDPLELHVANSLWGQKKLPFETPFLDTLAKNYGAGIFLADFVKDANGSREDINEWVSKQTNDKIPDLLAPGTVTSETRLILVDAMYFNAGWQNPFEPSATKTKKFSRLDGSKKSVPIMSAGGGYGYTEGAGYQAVEMRYAGNETSMVVVLPKDGKFASIEHGLSGPFVEGVFNSLSPAEVNVELPKFTIKGPAVNIRPELERLGMKKAFSGAADFSGIVDPSVTHLQVDGVLHKAFVAVDEKGTEAAAATAVTLGGSASPGGVKEFRANRPFFFFIRDVPTNTVLFVGRVVDPA